MFSFSFSPIFALFSFYFVFIRLCFIFFIFSQFLVVVESKRVKWCAEWLVLLICVLPLHLVSFSLAKLFFIRLLAFTKYNCTIFTLPFFVASKLKKSYFVSILVFFAPKYVFANRNSLWTDRDIGRARPLHSSSMPDIGLNNCCFYMRVVRARSRACRAQLFVHTFLSDISVEIAIAITVALVQFFKWFSQFLLHFLPSLCFFVACSFRISIELVDPFWFVVTHSHRPNCVMDSWSFPFHIVFSLFEWASARKRKKNSTYSDTNTPHIAMAKDRVNINASRIREKYYQ